MISLFLFILGLAVGSFLNVLIDRLPNEQSITGRSHCDDCKHTLAWYDLVPIISFFVLAGKCRYCGKKFSLQYPLVEGLTGIAFVFGGMGGMRDMGVVGLMGWVGIVTLLGILSTLIVIFFADLKYQIIPDSMQVAAFLFGLGYKGMGVVGGMGDIKGLNTWLYGYMAILVQSFVAAAVVMSPILFLFLVTRGRGMGFGDVKLAFTMGFLLGIAHGLMALYLGFITGAIVGVGLIILKKKKLKSKIAFGPFLVLGTVVMLFWGNMVVGFVKGMFGS